MKESKVVRDEVCVKRVQQSTTRDPEMEEISTPRIESKKKTAAEGWSAARPGVVLVACLMTLPVLVFLPGHYWTSSFVWINAVKMTKRIDKGPEDGSIPNSLASKDKLLGGLLSPNFDEQSCLSRYKSALYHKASPHLPSSYLVHKLRTYEALHKKCGPNTPLYKKSIEQLKSGHSMELMDCNYIIWTPYNGLGNRILSLVSAFLYALLTDRVLLIHVTEDSTDLWCEPFPDTTWVLPSDFPIKDLTKLHGGTKESYGNLLRDNKISNNPKTVVVSLPSYIYLHLEHNYQHLDRLFFCDEDQMVLGKVNWLILQSDLYFVPSFFSIPAFEDELRWLFPARESIFHLLVRYLIHPTNTIWGMVTRYYDSYLAKSNERIGIQIRIFQWAPIGSDDLINQILACSKQENLLPDIELENRNPSSTNVARSKAVLVTSLYQEYFDKFQSMYYENSAKTGDLVSVYQPSHEGHQSSEKQFHNQKALAEIYLLSFCDVLVTSAVSTFGYVSHGLAGLKPWFLPYAKNRKASEIPCIRFSSMEPCLHTPPRIGCRGNRTVDTIKLQRHVRTCEDLGEGIKLFD
ncbi:galactoside 2-alpha-L-fucosyltransferase-like [Typha latifolia]|uniref:galactoside 2-alpha-L-fucosyltransferase-like n=1 Tax=Typha latifolia TaxID=4733 RepID=UPI003C30281C